MKLDQVLVSIVDDDESVREAMKSLVRSFGYSVETFSSAAEFLTSAQVENTDCLEPISKLSEEDNEAGELDKAEEVLSVVVPADEDATLPLYSGEEPLDEPASRVTA
jgi:CheY-like chemotaxis protein